ncbi:MAG: DNA polymerase III subunit delta [Oscillospiraceae bacterium]|nr:DNA polymerase III subunit delta [Oscillospiraceae bacterium]
MKITEDILKENLKLNKLSNLYYFFGKEVFLVKTYADRVREKFAPDLDEFNLIKFSGTPDFDSLEEAVETLPVFAEKKVVLLNDFDAEKIEIDTLERMIILLSDIPEYCAVIINITGFEPSKNAKTKKLLAAVEKHGIVCEFDLLSRAKAARLIADRVARLGCIISLENAEYLYDLTLGSLTLIGSEYKKLASFTGVGNEITREIIDRLTPRLTETSVYELAAALTEKRAKKAFKILDDLMAQNVQPVIILSSLSGAFTDYYRAKLGKNYKQNPDKTATDFNYPKNRAWLMKKVPASDLNKIKNCISLLYKADIKLKSTTLNNRTVIEKTMTEILVL